MKLGSDVLNGVQRPRTGRYSQTSRPVSTSVVLEVDDDPSAFAVQASIASMFLIVMKFM